MSGQSAPLNMTPDQQRLSPDRFQTLGMGWAKPANDTGDFDPLGNFSAF